ncbi:uncharacterized protein LOC122264454 [Penaeus japonicus]|uniref:uncharacterized protein LOC122264454 n=1 Tax=Penaeus japonicus TaxID=27405 RepID=UPI001C70E316|nr:uncharacterized protein LOC122264454 [Penaeus japonicus]
MYGASTNGDIELPKTKNFSSIACFSKTLSSAQAPHQNGLPMNASDSEPVTEIPSNINTAPHNTTEIPSEFSEANTGGSETSIASGSTAAEARTEMTTAVSSNDQPTRALLLGASTASANCTESDSNDSGGEGESSESCE